MGALALLLAGVFAACQPATKPHREVFEEAETAYRAGHYDRALERYEVFLKSSPDHQLAPLAQQRILSIERELEVVMGRREGPRPIYLRPIGDGPEGPLSNGDESSGN